MNKDDKARTDNAIRLLLKYKGEVGLCTAFNVSSNPLPLEVNAFNPTTKECDSIFWFPLNKDGFNERLLVIAFALTMPKDMLP